MKTQQTTSMKLLTSAVIAVLLLSRNVTFSNCYVTSAWGDCVTAGQVISGTCTTHNCIPYLPIVCGCTITTSGCTVGTQVSWDGPCGNTQYITSKTCTVGTSTKVFLGCNYQPPWVDYTGYASKTCSCAEAGGGENCNMAGCVYAGITTKMPKLASR